MIGLTKKLIAVSAMLAVITTAGCATHVADPAENAGGPSLPAGADKQEYVDALSDMQSVDMVYQSATGSPESASAKRDREFVDNVKEWSGGKIDIELVYAESIASATEVPDALDDGRLDFAHFNTTYEPDQHSAFATMTNGLSQIPSSPLLGDILVHFVGQEVAFETPEVMQEFEKRGMHAINPFNPIGNHAMICTDEKQTPEDFSGNQIRGNAAGHNAQVDALDGALVTIDVSETFEALQRNLLDCSIQAPATGVAAGWVPNAPHVTFPKSSSFVSGAGSFVAGRRWSNLPLAAQQLVYDKMNEYTSAELWGAYQGIIDMEAAAHSSGGSITQLDQQSDLMLSKANARLRQEAKADSDLDGEKLISDITQSMDKWTRVAKEMNYTDDGEYSTFADWYKGSDDFNEREYLEPISQKFFDDVISKQRPQQ